MRGGTTGRVRGAGRSGARKRAGRRLFEARTRRTVGEGDRALLWGAAARRGSIGPGFFPTSRQREKLPRRRAKTRVEKNSVPRTPRSNARSGRGPRPEERPREVMRLCFTTSHPPARALPLAAAVVVVVALGHPLHVSGKKISHHHHSAGLRPPPPLFTLRSSPGGSRLVGVLFRTPIIFPVHATQVLGFLNASRASASLDPSSGCMSYCHLAVSGRDMRMDSILPPVRRPKVVPRS